MRRVTAQRFVEPMAQALAILPPRIRAMLDDTPILTGVNPVFAGLHRDGDTDDGRSYSDTAHVVYPFHQEHRPAASRETTVVLPSLYGKGGDWRDVRTVVHELGHVLDERLGFTETVPAVNDYALTNRREAFAEAFTTWVWGPAPRWWGRAKDPFLILLEDGRAPALFEKLTKGA